MAARMASYGLLMQVRRPTVRLLALAYHARPVPASCSSRRCCAAFSSTVRQRGQSPRPLHDPNATKKPSKLDREPGSAPRESAWSRRQAPPPAYEDAQSRRQSDARDEASPNQRASVDRAERSSGVSVQAISDMSDLLDFKPSLKPMPSNGPASVYEAGRAKLPPVRMNVRFGTSRPPSGPSLRVRSGDAADEWDSDFDESGSAGGEDVTAAYEMTSDPPSSRPSRHISFGDSRGGTRDDRSPTFPRQSRPAGQSSATVSPRPSHGEHNDILKPRTGPPPDQDPPPRLRNSGAHTYPDPPPSPPPATTQSIQQLEAAFVNQFNLVRGTGSPQKTPRAQASRPLAWATEASMPSRDIRPSLQSRLPPDAYGRHPPASNIDIPIPHLPAEVQRFYAYESYLCFERTAGPGSPVGLRALPPVVDLVAAHELFGCYAQCGKYNQLAFVRGIHGIPDVVVCGRADVGKSQLVEQLGGAARAMETQLLKKGLLPEIVTTYPPVTAPDTIAWGFRPLVKREWAFGAQMARIRVLDPPGLGHWKSKGHSVPQFGLMLRKRRNICGAIVVISAVSGPGDTDAELVAELVKRRYPFVVALHFAHPLVPSLQDQSDSYPMKLWPRLQDTAAKVFDMIDAAGATDLNNGIYAVGARTFHHGPVGLLGLKHAIARMVGLVGNKPDDAGVDGSWTRLDPKSGTPTMEAAEPLTEEETPMTAAFVNGTEPIPTKIASRHEISAIKVPSKFRNPPTVTRMASVYRRISDEQAANILRLYGGKARLFVNKRQGLSMSDASALARHMYRLVFSEETGFKFKMPSKLEIEDVFETNGGLMAVMEAWAVKHLSRFQGSTQTQDRPALRLIRSHTDATPASIRTSWRSGKSAGSEPPEAYEIYD